MPPQGGSFFFPMSLFYQQLNAALKPVFSCSRTMSIVLAEAAKEFPQLATESLATIALRDLSSDSEWSAYASQFIFKKVPVSILEKYAR